MQEITSWRARASSPESSASFYSDVEALRGLAALMVALGHAFIIVIPFQVNLAPDPTILATLSFNRWANFALTSFFNGSAAVNLFFVISGFVLSNGMRSGDTLTVRYYLRFMIRRVFRIMPAAWFSIFFAAYVDSVYIHTDFHTNWPSALLLGDSAAKLNGPLWTLQIEMAVSLIFPFLAFANLRFGPAAQIFVLYLLLLLSNTYGFPYWTVFLFCFQLGIMVPTIGVPAIKNMRRGLFYLLMTLAGLAFLAPMNLSRLGFIVTKEQIAIETLGAFFILSYVVATNGKANSILSWSPCRFLGRISFSFYLTHLLIMQPIMAFIQQSIGQQWCVQHLILFQMCCVFVTIPTCIAFATLSYFIIEVPFHRFGKNVSQLLWQFGSSSRPQPTLPA